jgi:hypothetical protein
VRGIFVLRISKACLTDALGAAAVILERHRTTLLDLFPHGVPLLVLAPAAQPDLVAHCVARNDPASAAATFAADGRIDRVPAGRAFDNVVLEGLDAVDEPVALLRAIRAAAPAARLFALVANAASLSGLAAFVAGVSLAPAHPLVRAELEPLFADGDYGIVHVDELENALDEAERVNGGLRLGMLLAAELGPDDERRLRTDAFLVIADARS